MTGENEVSNFNEETGSLDANDNWIVKMPEAGSEWKMATNISLFHPSSSANLASRPIDSGNARFNYTMGHQEVWMFCLSMEDREQIRANSVSVFACSKISTTQRGVSRSESQKAHFCIVYQDVLSRT